MPSNAMKMRISPCKGYISPSGYIFTFNPKFVNTGLYHFHKNSLVEPNFPRGPKIPDFLVSCMKNSYRILLGSIYEN